MNFLPAPFVQIIQDTLPGFGFEPLDGQFDLLRVVKTSEEVVKIRRSLALCDLAQEFVRVNASPGITEIVLWGRLKTHLELFAGDRLPILADLVAGKRTAEIGGSPGKYILQPGDALIADIVPRLDGYWGDNAATYFLGEVSQELSNIYQLVSDTLQGSIEAVRPGLRASDLDALMRSAIQERGYEPYPHHSGHGIGVSYHEEPRIVPYNPIKLQPDMVVALEPGIYVPGLGGVRLEEVLLVTSAGYQVLTHHLRLV